MRGEDDLGWYARRADGLRRPVGLPRAPAAGEARVEALLASLEQGGIKGSAKRRTLYTRRLPSGCRGCLAGRGTNAFVTGLCTRECFFCFNEKPRRDELVVHGIPLDEPEEAPAVVARYGLRSVGISGGEPTLKPQRLNRLVRALRALPFPVRLDLYTNGDALTPALLAELKEAGLDSVRLNLVARDFELGPVARALAVFPETTVEVPVVPALMRELEDMVLRLDALGVPFLNIHELFACRENSGALAEAGHAAGGAEPAALQWEPVAGADEAALSLLLFAQRNAGRLSVYYCSCRTQEDIAARGLRRRAGLAAGAAP